MPLEIKKEGKELPQNLVRRFLKKVKQSGILLEKKKSFFFERKKSKKLKRRSALRREELKRYYEQLKKMGKIK